MNQSTFSASEEYGEGYCVGESFPVWLTLSSANKTLSRSSQTPKFNRCASDWPGRALPSAECSASEREAFLAVAETDQEP